MAGLSVKQGISTVLAAFVCASMLLATGCGSSDGRDNPAVPFSRVTVLDVLVDIGERFEMTGAFSTDPEDDGLTYFWTKIHPTSETEFDEHCEDVTPQTVCFFNTDDQCLNDDSNGDPVFCQTNDDCTNEDDDRCITNSGTTSPQCGNEDVDDICLLGFSRIREFASFAADRPGPYSIRLFTETSKGGTNVAERLVSTYPQLLVVGSMFGFGGARGALIEQYPDADSFAPTAVAGASSPVNGNMLLAVTEPGLVREFSLDDGSIVGTFGETGSVGINPIDLVFGLDETLYLVDADGMVTRFDGTNGLFIGILGDVTAGNEEVVSIAIRPSNGNLLAVDGRAGQPIREYGINTGNLRGPYGDTGTAVGRSVDIAFDTENTAYIADGDGDIIVCDTNGENCGSLVGASDILAANGPTSIALNPAAAQTTAQVLVADSVSQQVVGCLVSGGGCAPFGDTSGLASVYADIFFAPPDLPTTTTTTFPPTTVTTSTSTTTSTTMAP